ncbi:hypothetical protein M407DRAFT_22678 [Tulasnella calospora MUT 4182]|uniref:Arginyl-tRNA synthetase catalytic core domain-containing protein n=1 Tax=Tulasnella calospora MUT 4182 TaxID=1051891 RepID=A0A0C3QKT0_9AGAM|nr:hypothetical protein M407DRAFT_22678 [Tulasnella calospora MUT 4182]
MDPHFPLPKSEPSANFLHIIGTSIASSLATILGDEVNQVVYASIEISTEGPYDLELAVPKLGAVLKDMNPSEVAAKVAKEYTPDELIEAVAASGSSLSFNIRSASMMRQALEMIYSTSQTPKRVGIFIGEGRTLVRGGEKLIRIFHGNGRNAGGISPSGNRPIPLPRIFPTKRGYGTNTLGNGKRLVIEFSSPDIAMPFHVGHRRSTVIGAALSNLYAANGWDVTKLNYLGDLGTQCALLAAGFDKHGSKETLEKEDPIMYLYSVYLVIYRDFKAKEGQRRDDTKQMVKDYFKRLEKGDPHLIEMLQRFRELSILEYIKIYERLNVQFDVYDGESLVSAESIKDVMDQLGKQGLLIGVTTEDGRKSKRGKIAALKVEEDENKHKDLLAKDLALAIDLNEFKLGKPVLQNPDGTATPILRDIAAAIDRYHKYHFDKMLYVVGSQQNLHFAQCFKILSLLKDCPFDASEKLKHINFSQVKGMAIPTLWPSANLVFLKDMLDSAKETMSKRIKASPENFETIEDLELTSDQIGMTAVKVQDMQAKRIMSYHLDWERVTPFEGDTGPYLQYTHVRLCSMERMVALEDGLAISSLESIDTSLLLSTPKAREIVFYLATFPDVVRTALKTTNQAIW